MPDIKQVRKEYDELLEQLSDPELISNWPASPDSRASRGGEKLEELFKRKGSLEKTIAKDGELKEVKSKIAENKEIIQAQEDKELVSLAEAEIVQLQGREKNLEKELEELLRGGGNGPQAVIVEIRAGTGGEEAALFAGDLYQMYAKYAQLQGWRQKVLESHPTELGGFKEVIFELKDGNVFGKMRFEGGVHRVQRIPTTEKAGRIHTSTASVAVLPKPNATEIKINPKDLKVDVYKSSGPGGQYVNKRMTAVRITHAPSGIVVTSQTERNLQQNKENAMSILGARILEKTKSEQVEKMGEKRKAQIKGAQRADKIRTYNFPQDRVTDHRIQKSFHHLEGIMAGKLEPLIEALIQSFK